jgi:glycosyltransferase involved in cell wall biosynthesis
MTRILYFLPFMGIGGTEQMVLQLCRCHNRTEFECIVAAPAEGVIVDEIRRTGVPVITGPNALAAAALGADLINLHWCNYSLSLLSQVQAMGKPFVTTLQWDVALPWVPAVTICASENGFQIQTFRDQCVFIRNGVDLSSFAPHPRVDRERVIIIRVCRPSRCALYFWDTMRQVLDRYPQTELWIVGVPGDHQWHSDRVRFLGIRRDIPQILAQTDIFVNLPHPNSGATDLVAMEAAAAGLPCVVSDVNSVRGSVVEGETGYLTQFGDGAAVVERVGRLIEDAPLRARMGCAAVELARERFDMTRIARRYEIVYRAVLEACRNLKRRPVQRV